MTRGDSAPDRVLMGGQIVTACGAHVVEAMAVRGNRISAVGGNDEIVSLAGPSTEVVHLDGRSVVPGINDSHVHLGYFGAVLPPLAVNVGFPAVRSIAEVATAVGAADRVGGWVKGNGWDIGYLEDADPGRLPRCEDLDPVSADVPVALRDFSGHQLWVNSRALELAGINEHTADPDAGVIVRDERGHPTGILQESATALIDRLLPPLTDLQFDRALDSVRDLMHAEGITSVTDAALGPGGNAFQGGAAGERFLQRLSERAGREDFSHANDGAARVQPADDLKSLRRRGTSPRVHAAPGQAGMVSRCRGQVLRRRRAAQQDGLDEPAVRRRRLRAA